MDDVGLDVVEQPLVVCHHQRRCLVGLQAIHRVGNVAKCIDVQTCTEIARSCCQEEGPETEISSPAIQNGGETTDCHHASHIILAEKSGKRTKTCNGSADLSRSRPGLRPQLPAPPAAKSARTSAMVDAVELISRRQLRVCIGRQEPC